MPREIIVNIDTRETRVAVVEDGKLVELHIEREERVAGSIYKCKVSNVLPGMDAAFVDVGLERNAFLYVADVLPEADDEYPAARKEAARAVHIKDVLKIGQELLVQIVKGPRGTKGARVSTRVSLPGRYIVLMPEADNVGVSRKIEDSQERDRLKRVADKIRPLGFGMIVRTEAEGQSESELRHDLDFLLRMWDQIQEKSKRIQAPGLVHQELSLVYKTIRDVFSSEVHKMIIDSPVDYERAVELVELLSPRMKSRIALYDDAEPIFEHFAIESEIDRLLRRKVWLRSGGHLTIDETEALTTIDVNTGKFIGSTSLADTILKNNLEAATEIARQMRLRDIGGMIIIDFIDMVNPKDKQHVVTSLEKALRKDRTRTKISHISPLGLVEMTRKRTGETISEVITEACPYCQGRGKISSPETLSIQVERDLRKIVSEVDEQAFLVTVHPDVAIYLIGPHGETIDAIEKQLRKQIYVRSNENMHIEKYEIAPGDLHAIEKQALPFKKSETVECQVVRNPFTSLPASTSWMDGYMVDLENGGKYIGQRVKAKLKEVKRSYAVGEVIATPKSKSLDKSKAV
jgi:ribonuclease G